MRGAMVGSPGPQIAPGRTTTVERLRSPLAASTIFSASILLAVYASLGEGS